MNQNHLKSRYQSIWDDHKASKFNTATDSHPTKLLDRHFVFQYDEDETSCELLFIGINPSYKGYNSNDIESYTREQALQHAYFKPFEEITDKLNGVYKHNIKWTHLDCLVFRETNQKFVQTDLFGSEEGLDFIMMQLEIARKRIEHIKPKVIVVGNTLARHLMGLDRKSHKEKLINIWMGLEFDFCPNLGTYKIINHDFLNETPVFFTSMLSGQRALDNGSKERLVWHIARALK